MPSARELRFAFAFDDHDAALRLFRDVFGLEVLEEFRHEGSRGVIMRVPSATLELFDREYAGYVDEVEAGTRFGELVRVAVKVDALEEASAAAQAAGARPVAEPSDTPWGDRNQRLTTPDGLQLTLFQSPGEDG